MIHQTMVLTVDRVREGWRALTGGVVSELGGVSTNEWFSFLECMRVSEAFIPVVCSKENTSVNHAHQGTANAVYPFVYTVNSFCWGLHRTQASASYRSLWPSACVASLPPHSADIPFPLWIPSFRPPRCFTDLNRNFVK